MLAVAVVCGSAAAALGVCEGVLNALALYRPPPREIRPEQPEIYRPDPFVGYTLWPSRTISHRYPPEDGELIPLTSNSDGFRNAREFDGRDQRARILVVGDSFVFGLGVRAEDRLTEQLEAFEPRWRVDNMGMTGWGLDLMVRAVEHLGAKADPDVVVLVMYTDDFRRLHPYYAGVGYPFAKFELVGAQLVSTAYEYPKSWERLRLVQALYQLNWQRDRDRLQLNGALLDRYAALARTMGFAPAIVFAPGTNYTDGDRLRQGFLSDWAAARGIPYRDLTGAIHGAGVEKTFLPNNWHWSPLGHRIAAAELRSLLQRYVFEGSA